MVEPVQKFLTEKYNFLYVEDVVSENDWAGWQIAAKQITRAILIGDDLTVTNIKRMKKAKDLGIIGGFIFKPNQIGTITESIEAYEFACSNNWLTIPSGRAGGVINDVIFDFAVAYNCPCVKMGAPRRGDSIYGINFLLRSENLNPGAKPFDFTPYLKFN